MPTTDFSPSIPVHTGRRSSCCGRSQSTRRAVAAREAPNAGAPGVPGTEPPGRCGRWAEMSGADAGEGSGVAALRRCRWPRHFGIWVFHLPSSSEPSDPSPVIGIDPRRCRGCWI
jgi:hypothetical protein